MNNEEIKKEMLSFIKPTEKTLDFIKKIYNNHGNLIENAKGDVSSPELIGYGRLSNGQLIMITGNVRDGETMRIPLKITEITEEDIDELIKAPESNMLKLKRRVQK